MPPTESLSETEQNAPANDLENQAFPARRTSRAHTELQGSAYQIVSSGTRLVETAVVRFEDDARRGLVLQIREKRTVRAGRPAIAIDLPATAIDAAIEALCRAREAVVAELGPGATQRRNAPMHGTWIGKRGGR